MADHESPPAAPGSSGEEPDHTAEEEPVTTGTLFIMILFLMALAGLWLLMYLILLQR
jgi:hypothetical protein